MGTHTIKRGLNLPITGAPEQRIVKARDVSQVAVVALDYVGMRPRIVVNVGDSVKRGQLLFEDRKNEGVRYTAPGAGRVAAVHRGDKRALQSIVIELTDGERTGKPAPDELQTFEAHQGASPSDYDREGVLALLVESGVFTAFRQRPYGRVPSPGGDAPHSIFVTAIDTNPLAADVETALEGMSKHAVADFDAGLAAVAKLTKGKTYLCKQGGARISKGKAKVEVEEFVGPHPAGTAGVHIHLLDPVDRHKTVWHIGYQDVVGIGELLRTGTYPVTRVIALGGPTVDNPRLLRTREGASLEELLVGELDEVQYGSRVVSGSVLFGRTAMGEVHGFLSRYSLQVSALQEGRERVLFGAFAPFIKKFSILNLFPAAMRPGEKFDFTTNTNGSHRMMVPLGLYEQVFPFDMMPTHLLRSVLMGDLARAEELGLLELDEEDVALCTFVCQGKNDYGTALRDNLDRIWKEG